MPKENDETEESGQEDGGGKAKSVASSNGGQHTSTVDAEAIAKALEPWLEDRITRKLQGEKDRRINKIERRLDTTEGALNRIAELVKGGMNIDQAQQQLRLESAIEYVESIRQQPEGGNSAETSPRSGGGDRQVIEEAAALLEDAGLDNDAEWASLVSKGFANAHEAVKAAANLIVRNGSSRLIASSGCV